MTDVLVVRHPVLMEDEGRYTVVRSFSSVREAQEWIDKQANEYFKPGDYSILEEGQTDERSFGKENR